MNRSALITIIYGFTAVVMTGIVWLLAIIAHEPYHIQLVYESIAIINLMSFFITAIASIYLEEEDESHEPNR